MSMPDRIATGEVASDRIAPVKYDLSRGAPRDPRLFLECSRCGELIRTQPAETVVCRCGKTGIDLDAGRAFFAPSSRIVELAEANRQESRSTSPMRGRGTSEPT